MPHETQELGSAQDGHEVARRDGLQPEVSRRLGGSAGQSIEDLLVFRKTLRLLLRPDELAVNGDFKSSAPGRNHFELLYFGSPFQQLRRQTDGSIGVVSDYAVFDFDLHSPTPPDMKVQGPTDSRQCIPPPSNS